jgi:hypothetical protein
MHQPFGPNNINLFSAFLCHALLTRYLPTVFMCSFVQIDFNCGPFCTWSNSVVPKIAKIHRWPLTLRSMSSTDVFDSCKYFVLLIYCRSNSIATSNGRWTTATRIEQHREHSLSLSTKATRSIMTPNTAIYCCALTIE